MFFYAMFPILVGPVRRSSWRGLIAWALLAVCLTRMMWAVGVSDEIKPLVPLSDFLMGITAACAYDLLFARARPPRGWWLYLPGFAAAAAMLAYPDVLPKAIDVNSALRVANGAFVKRKEV